MFIRKFYNGLSKDNKEDFVGGLVGGLVWGLVVGLVVGLVGGLVWGLVWGLVVGQYGLNNTFIIVLGIIVFVLMEVMYYISNRNNKKKLSLWNVLLLKLEELGEILLVVVNLLNLLFLGKQINISWKQEYNEMIIRFLGYSGIIVIIIALFIWYLWVNRYLITRKVKKTGFGGIKNGRNKRR